ncbi:FtsX-like permease family protein [Dinghuibacter silviterrae]|nr:FtsX-like permease family protein [Dinghuibacter silviterrae]
MLRNYLLVALRQLRRQKMYASIMIGGFALSIAACILITLYIRDELSYDRYIPRADQAFRVVEHWAGGDYPGRYTDFAAPFGPGLMSDYTGVEKSGRLMNNSLFYGAGANQIRRADQTQNTYEEGFVYADQSLLDILGMPMIYGTAGHALDAPHSLVMTRRMAEKYFPHQNPVGQVFYLNNDTKTPYTIGGVIPDFASTSSLPYDFFLTLKGVELWQGEQTFWGANNYDTYVLLKPGTDVNAFQRAVTASELQRHIIPFMKSSGQKDVETKTKGYAIELQPVRDIYLRSYAISDDLPSHGDMRLVWMFGGIAAFILLIACVNFVNLATARSANRAKEIGLRKVIGSYRSSLVRQFLTESLVYSLLSFALALLLAQTLLPFFNHLTGKSLSLPWGSLWFAPFLLGSAFLLGIVSGLYPAYYLSAFKPVKVLKGQVARGSKNARLRSVLVVFQFTTSIILIAGTLVVYSQMQYILHRKVGFNKDQVLVIQGTNTIADIQAFKNDLLRLPQAKSVAISDFLPIDIPGAKLNQNAFYMYGRKGASPVFAQDWSVDYEYLQTMGMQLSEGRDFSRTMASDTGAIIINETMARKMGIGAHPLGAVLDHFGRPFHVVGVVRDFNFQSFRTDIDPVCLTIGISPSMVSVRTVSDRVGGLIPQVDALWKKYVPNQALRYTFLDDGFRRMYADVERDGSILTCFTVLAIIIACLGLFALSSFMAEQRTKEIGIRKVLGASVHQLLVLMSREFVLLILLALAIAIPIAWWAMHAWLQDFKYREDISGWLFLAVGGIALAIALATTSYQSLRAALENPIKSLKTE